MMATVTEHLTTCRLCGEVVAKNKRPLDIPLEGMPDIRGLRYLSGLQDHLKSKHQQNAAALEAAAREFGGMLLAVCYKADDESFNARADLIRDTFINQFARQISDQDLDALIDRTMQGNQSGEKILHREQAQQMIRALRDLFTCRGQYAPKTSALTEAPLVTVP